jgi:hypothetical protein
MMEGAWRRPATGTWPDWTADWMIPFAETIDGAKKYVVSGTLDRVDWNAELVRGDLGKAVQELKAEPGEGLFVGGDPPAGLGGSGVDRRVRVPRAARRGGPRADAVRRPERAARPEARGPPGVPVGGGGAALRARSRHGVTIGCPSAPGTGNSATMPRSTQACLLTPGPGASARADLTLPTWGPRDKEWQRLVNSPQAAQRSCPSLCRIRLFQVKGAG